MNQRMYVIVLGGVIALASILVVPAMRASLTESEGPLKFEVVLDKESYLVGEPVHLKFKVTNQSDRPTSLYRGSTVWDGYIDVFVAYQGDDFRRYRGPQWGLRDAYYKNAIVLNPGEVFQSEATMLCNPKLRTDHLNETAAKHAQRRENLVQGNYILSKPGYYFVKAILRDPISANTVESESVRIFAQEPRGDDLEVWNQIKDRRDYAFFIQTGSLADPTDEPTKKVVEKLEEIVRLHPASKYADGIQKSLSEHRAAISRIKRGLHPETEKP